MTDAVQKDSDTPSPRVFDTRPTVQSIAIMTATFLISVAFYKVALPFVMALALAGICAELCRPFYGWLLTHTGGREAISSALTLLSGLLIVILPLTLIAYLAVSQASIAINESEHFSEVISRDFAEMKEGQFQLPDWLPYSENLKSLEPKITERASELTSQLASYFVAALSHVTSGTSSFLLQLFAFLYALFFFLPMPTSIFAKLLRYTGLPTDLQGRLDAKIISVSRATLKGTLTIGLIQGVLGGIGFAVAGINGAVFWAVVMTVLAAIPALGATPVVILGAIYLGFNGEMGPAIGLGLWGMLVVGTIDNVLRPKLVGKDAAMSDLWIFVSTLGGLAAFGAAGLVFGPVIAGLFITIWEQVSGIKAPEPEPEPKPQPKPEPDPGIDAPKPKPAPSAGREFKITASKEELEVEIEALKRELQSTPPRAGKDHDKP